MLAEIVDGVALAVGPFVESESAEEACEALGAEAALVP